MVAWGRRDSVETWEGLTSYMGGGMGTPLVRFYQFQRLETHRVLEDGHRK